MKRSSKAFTLLELLMVIAIIAILSARLMPALSKAKLRTYRIRCVSDLKQTGVAFHLFATDHSHKFPMEVPMADGGSREFVSGGNAYRHFVSLSNDLSPRLLTCPSDTRAMVLDWPAFSNEHLSYFVGVDASPDAPNSMLAGDRNISSDSVQKTNTLQTTYATNVQWTAGLHEFKGNILFSDGHVSELGDDGLRTAMQAALAK